MADYNYQGVDRSGKKVTGKISAQDEGQLRMLLRSQGVRPVRIRKLSMVNQDIGSLLGGGKARVPTEILVSTTRQLHVLISSGVPLLQALEVLCDQTTHLGLKNILVVVREKVSQGAYLWESLALYPKVFPKLYIALVRAGEASGSLDGMLKRLSRYLEDAYRIKKMLKGAMIYPLATLGVGGIVMIILLTFVIPKFEELLKGNGQELPGPTQFVINLSHFFANNVFVIFGALIIAGYLVGRYANSSEGRALIDRILYRAPIFGPLTQKAAMARFSRTMQTLLSSGVNLIDAIDICKATVDNSVMEEAVGKIRGSVEAGKTLGSVVAKLEVFPRMAVEMISIGESTGNLDKMLEKVADFYEEEVEIFVGGMSKLIEPVILVALGTMVGGMLVAMYLPIFKLAGAAGE